MTAHPIMKLVKCTTSEHIECTHIQVPSCQMSSSKWQKLPPKHTPPGQESNSQSKTVLTDDKLECPVEN